MGPALRRKENRVKHILHKLGLAFASIQPIVLVLVTTGAVMTVAGQVGAGETVIQKATEQFENNPLKVTSLGKGLFMSSGDGGNVTAIVDDGSTLIIDSGVDSRATELNDAIFKATLRPVTRLVNTHWHFDHTGGNVFLGSSGVTIIAQENVKKAALVGAGRPLRWLARWSLPVTGTPNSNLFKKHGVASRSPATDIGQLWTCAYRWRHNHLYCAGERGSGRGHFLESLLSHHRSGVRRINRWDDLLPRSRSGAD